MFERFLPQAVNELESPSYPCVDSLDSSTNNCDYRQEDLQEANNSNDYPSDYSQESNSLYTPETGIGSPAFIIYVPNNPDHTAELSSFESTSHTDNHHQDYNPPHQNHLHHQTQNQDHYSDNYSVSDHLFHISCR